MSCARGKIAQSNNHIGNFNAGAAFDGVNMWPVLMGQTNHSYDELLLQSDPLSDRFGYRMGDYKLIKGD